MWLRSAESGTFTIDPGTKRGWQPSKRCSPAANYAESLRAPWFSMGIGHLLLILVSSSLAAPAPAPAPAPGPAPALPRESDSAALGIGCADEAARAFDDALVAPAEGFATDNYNSALETEADLPEAEIYGTDYPISYADAEATISMHVATEAATEEDYADAAWQMIREDRRRRAVRGAELGALDVAAYVYVGEPLPADAGAVDEEEMPAAGAARRRSKSWSIGPVNEAWVRKNRAAFDRAGFANFGGPEGWIKYPTEPAMRTSKRPPIEWFYLRPWGPWVPDALFASDPDAVSGSVSTARRSARATPSSRRYRAARRA